MLNTSALQNSETMWTFANAPERCHREDFLFRETIWEWKAFHTRGSNICRYNQGINRKNNRGITSFSFSGKTVIAWTQETEATRCITNKPLVVTDFLTGKIAFIISTSCMSLHEAPTSLSLWVHGNRWYKHLHHPSSFTGKKPRYSWWALFQTIHTLPLCTGRVSPPGLGCVQCWEEAESCLAGAHHELGVLDRIRRKYEISTRGLCWLFARENRGIGPGGPWTALPSLHVLCIQTPSWGGFITHTQHESCPW